MFTFVQYEEKDQATWDRFIDQEAINGTFLQGRRFLNYHPAGRFEDCSLMIYNEKGNLAALCPACILHTEGKTVFFSHRGSTFGGVITDRKHYCAKYILPMVEELKAHVQAQGFDSMVLKQASDLFSLRESDLFQYACQHAGFTEYKELSTYVDFDRYPEPILGNFSQGKRTNIHNGDKAGLTLKPLDTREEIAVFYEILQENLSKYDTKPVHTLDELYDLRFSRLPGECGFYGVFQGEEMLSGSMMFYFPRVSCAHTQYLAARQAYNKLSPMTYMYYSMIREMKEKGYRHLSWGTATEDMGRYLNMGLITSKEDFGSSYCNNLTYRAELSGK